MELFKIALVRQLFDTSRLEDIEGTVYREMEGLGIKGKIKKGDKIAIGVGSRGITNIGRITKQVVDYLKSLEASPFIIPAMGSHGGATAEGQLKVLESLGITQEYLGCPIYSSLEVIKVGESEEGVPVYLDKFASSADHIVIINRIKPHTLFHGEIESGLLKMMVIGLGKYEGALAAHRAALRLGTDSLLLKKMARVLLQNYPPLFGLAIIENVSGETAAIKALAGNEIESEEPKLLAYAREILPKLPFETLDLLIVDELGKDISGAGMDRNVTGRGIGISKPKILRIFVRDLSEKSYGNATGIGQADFTTTRLVNKIDREATYANSLTSMIPESAKIPVYFDTDREALQAALMTIDKKAQEVEAVWIKNTSCLTEFYVSESLLPKVRERENLSLESEPQPLQFDAEGNLKRGKFSFERL